MLKIFNSLTKSKQIFKPIHPGKINLYVCGNTVYDYCHIGHARSMITFDVIVRYLREQNYLVNYVRNITDIDDKIIKRAQENQQSITDLTTRFIQAQKEDETALGLLPPNHEPRATEYIPQMINLIQKLLERGHAYQAVNGDVYFDVRSFQNYGRLTSRDIDQLRSGIRIELNDVKRDPLDFVLWKISKPEEPHWPSSWGEGRPGWHIECSVMSTCLLGQPFDIHGGGMDLKFPHHENEIAQSEASCDKEFAKLWMHVGLLQVNKEKMSKSLGNFFTIREVIAEYPPEILRYFMISGHYRSPINYSVENIVQAQNALHHLYLSLRDLPNSSAESEFFRRNFQEAMDDDFNTPEAIAVLFELSREINRLREQQQLAAAADLGNTLRNLGKILGILQQPPAEFLQGDASKAETQKIESLLQARDQARANKNWNEADRLRKEIESLGILIEDSASGTLWRRGR